MSNQTILRIDAVVQRTGVPKSSLYRMAAEGSFPKQVKLSKRSSGFIAAEVEQWIENRIKQSRQQTAAA